ncbi:hypothetical protein [Actinomadura parmotrematis]|uniref:Carboxypeptidase regulatory-like domain-containing protein n=1 Tax=Actinomadura parmotrematis TaxID=2864039 RepID=A0ABS7FWP2_9ACTN|nr:hypothetical protein [Actinomadura parmotrematis]MBW8484849.1 hypothetical protein [Actinomadura parmotrematis]
MSGPADEAELAAGIRAAFLAADPVPEGVLAAARAALALRLPGAALAGLAADDASAPAGARATTATRTLTFTGGGVTVELEASGDGEVTGRLTPPSPARVRLRRPAHADRTALADEEGCFALPCVGEGPVSLVVEPPGGDAVVTSWIRL